MADQPRIAHVGVAVPALDAALAFYRDVLGLVPRPVEFADGAAIVSLPLGESEIELLSPREPAGPIARFLGRPGARPPASPTDPRDGGRRGPGPRSSPQSPPRPPCPSQRGDPGATTPPE